MSRKTAQQGGPWRRVTVQKGLRRRQAASVVAWCNTVAPQSAAAGFAKLLTVSAACPAACRQTNSSDSVGCPQGNKCALCELHVCIPAANRVNVM